MHRPTATLRAFAPARAFLKPRAEARRRKAVAVALVLVSFLTTGAAAQPGQEMFPGFGRRRQEEQRGPNGSPRGAPPRGGPVNYLGEFVFTRAVYHSPYSPYGWRRGGTWATDFPEADNHFITGIREWAGTNLNVSPRPEHLEIMDERIFEYPLLYFVEPGFMDLSDEEAARLREYVMRGGFLFFDDFWGEAEWENVQTQMKKVLPEYEIKDLPRD